MTHSASRLLLIAAFRSTSGSACDKPKRCLEHDPNKDVRRTRNAPCCSKLKTPSHSGGCKGGTAGKLRGGAFARQKLASRLPLSTSSAALQGRRDRLNSLEYFQRSQRSAAGAETTSCQPGTCSFRFRAKGCLCYKALGTYS